MDRQSDSFEISTMYVSIWSSSSYQVSLGNTYLSIYVSKGLFEEEFKTKRESTKKCRKIVGIREKIQVLYYGALSQSRTEHHQVPSESANSLRYALTTIGSKILGGNCETGISTSTPVGCLEVEMRQRILMSKMGLKAEDDELVRLGVDEKTELEATWSTPGAEAPTRDEGTS